MPLLAIMLLVAGACSNDDDGGGDGGDTGATGATGAENTGTVNVLNAMEPAEAVAVQTAVDENIVDADYTVEIEGSADFEEQFAIRAEGGTLDIALVPQPGTVTSQAEAGTIVSLEDLGLDIAALQATFGDYLLELVEFDGEHWGIPTNVNLKSMVWYPKDDFDAAGYTVPTTWDELMALGDQIKADGGTPWCVGFESGGATGWPATDWMEDIMLRTAGVDTYDQWVNHEIPFNDPAVIERGRGVRRRHVHRWQRPGWRGRHAVDRVRRRTAADVPGPAGLLVAPAGELHHRCRAVPGGLGGGRGLRLVPASRRSTRGDPVRR